MLKSICRIPWATDTKRTPLDRDRLVISGGGKLPQQPGVRLSSARLPVGPLIILSPYHSRISTWPSQPDLGASGYRCVYHCQSASIRMTKIPRHENESATMTDCPPRHARQQASLLPGPLKTRPCRLPPLPARRDEAAVPALWFSHRAPKLWRVSSSIPFAQNRLFSFPFIISFRPLPHSSASPG